MQLRTTARDGLYINWALPRAAMPEPPAPLRYEVHDWQGSAWVFASALLFRVAGLRPPSLPIVGLSYPQAHVRLYVLDGDDVPSVFVRRLMVPFWVVPVSRWVGRQPAIAASFRYPSPSSRPGADSWTWRLDCRGRFQATARVAAPGIGHGPSLGDWRRTLDYFRRPRGYVNREGRPRPMVKFRPPADPWPVAVDIASAEPFARIFPNVPGEHWQRPHSAWLSPEIPLRFDIGPPLRLPLPTRRLGAVPDGV